MASATGSIGFTDVKGSGFVVRLPAGSEREPGAPAWMLPGGARLVVVTRGLDAPATPSRTIAVSVDATRATRSHVLTVRRGFVCAVATLTTTSSEQDDVAAKVLESFRLTDGKAGGVKEGVKLVASPTRCPWCHDRVAPDVEWTACKACLAKHHAECWQEAGACASCGDRLGMSSADGKKRLKPLFTKAERRARFAKKVEELKNPHAVGWCKCGGAINEVEESSAGAAAASLVASLALAALGVGIGVARFSKRVKKCSRCGAYA